MPILARRQPDPLFRFVVRFSVLDPANDAWRLSSHLDEERYRARLWDPVRLAVRTDIFVRRALPIYAQMARRHDVRVLVQHSPQLPVLGELEAAAREHPFLRLAPMSQARPMHETVHEDLAGSTSRGQAVMVRVDDDDLLAVDLLDQLLPFVTPEHQGWSVSLATGMVARHDGTGIRDFRHTRRPFRAIGLASIGGAARDPEPLWEPGNHMRVYEKRPAIVHGAHLAWLQILSEDQDSRTTEDRAQVGAGLLATLRKMPKVEDLAAVRAAFPSLAADVDRVERLRAGGSSVPG